MNEAAIRAALQKLNDATVAVDAILTKAKADIVNGMMPALVEAYATLGTPVVAPPAPATGYVPAIGNPPTEPKDTAAWFAFLDNIPVADAPGNLLSYFIDRGRPANVAIFDVRGTGAYPPILTHAQMYAAILQQIPGDRDVGCVWDPASRQWMQWGKPYVAPAAAAPGAGRGAFYDKDRFG